MIAIRVHRDEIPIVLHLVTHAKEKAEEPIPVVAEQQTVAHSLVKTVPNLGVPNHAAKKAVTAIPPETVMAEIRIVAPTVAIREGIHTVLPITTRTVIRNVIHTVIHTAIHTVEKKADTVNGANFTVPGVPRAAAPTEDQLAKALDKKTLENMMSRHLNDASICPLALRPGLKQRLRRRRMLRLHM